jgi:hypothetical protein
VLARSRARWQANLASRRLLAPALIIAASKATNRAVRPRLVGIALVARPLLGNVPGGLLGNAPLLGSVAIGLPGLGQNPSWLVVRAAAKPGYTLLFSLKCVVKSYLSKSSLIHPTRILNVLNTLVECRPRATLSSAQDRSTTSTSPGANGTGWRTRRRPPGGSPRSWGKSPSANGPRRTCSST